MNNCSLGKNLVLLCFFALLSVSAFAVTCSSQSGTAASPSNYASGATWSCGHIPTGADDIVIDHVVSSAAGLSFSGTQTITINAGAELRITGNLTLNGTTVTIVMNGGTLTISGTLALTNGGKLNFTSGSISSNTVSLTGSGSQLNYTAGTLATNNLTVNGGNTFSYTPSLSLSGNVTVASGSTVNASNVGGTITLSSSSKLNLTGSAAIAPTTITMSGTSELTYAGSGSLTYNTWTLAAGTKLNVSSGTVNVQDFTVLGTVTGSSTGKLAVTNTVELKNGGIVNWNSSGMLSAASYTTSGTGGKLNLNSGQLSITGVVDLSSDGELNTSSGSTSTIGSFTSSNSSTAVFNNAGVTSITGNVTNGGPINNSGTLNIGGSLNSSTASSAITTNSGYLNVTGSIDLPNSSKLQINPGGQTVVTGNVSVGSNLNLIVGTNVAAPPYADLAIKGNLTLNADMTIEKNGRFAVFGTLTATSGDSDFVIKSGGQAYVGGNLTQGAGKHLEIDNSNSTNPFGLYVNGTTTQSTVPAEDNIGTRAQMESSNPSFTTWVNSMNGLLPVKLLFFESWPDAESVRLTWATATELNFDAFIVERSADGLAFYEIGKVKGAGNSSVRRDYTFVDENPVIGRTYYRLTALDFDGATESFKIIKSDYAAQKAIKLFPNPAVAGQPFSVQSNFEPSALDQIEIYNSEGANLLHARFGVPTNKTMLGSELKPGNYLLLYKGADRTYTIRFAVK
jgi:hypothetical protein